MKKVIVIDGNNFSTLAGFYNEVEKKMTKGLDWKIGRNLDAFNDVLRGGFGVFEYEEPITLKWQEYEKGKNDLGFAETVKYIEGKLTRCHPSNVENVKKDLEEARRGKGKSIFEIIADIVRNHKHIEFITD